MLCLGGFLFYIKAAEQQSMIKINTQMSLQMMVLLHHKAKKWWYSGFRIKPVFSAVASLKTAAGILQINKFETVWLKRTHDVDVAANLSG